MLVDNHQLVRFDQLRKARPDSLQKLVKIFEFHIAYTQMDDAGRRL